MNTDARRMGKSELFSHFAERFEVKRTQAREFFDELTALAEKCNSSAIQSLVDKANSLNSDIDAAIAAGDQGKAAGLSMELRSVAMQANNLGNVCNRLQKIDKGLENAAEQRVQNIEKIKARIEARQTEDG